MKPSMSNATNKETEPSKNFLYSLIVSDLNNLTESFHAQITRMKINHFNLLIKHLKNKRLINQLKEFSSTHKDPKLVRFFQNFLENFYQLSAFFDVVDHEQIKQVMFNCAKMYAPIAENPVYDFSIVAYIYLAKHSHLIYLERLKDHYFKAYEFLIVMLKSFASFKVGDYLKGIILKINKLTEPSNESYEIISL